VADPQAQVERDPSFPSGETWYGSGSAEKLNFTSDERDAESGNDYAVFRYHVNRLGRLWAAEPIGAVTRLTAGGAIRA